MCTRPGELQVCRIRFLNLLDVIQWKSMKTWIWKTQKRCDHFSSITSFPKRLKSGDNRSAAFVFSILSLRFALSYQSVIGSDQKKAESSPAVSIPGIWNQPLVIYYSFRSVVTMILVTLPIQLEMQNMTENIFFSVIFCISNWMGR